MVDRTASLPFGVGFGQVDAVFCFTVFDDCCAGAHALEIFFMEVIDGDGITFRPDKKIELMGSCRGCN